VIHESDSEIRHGTKIGRFVVVGELGKGGMGVVYAAHDRELDRQVALKVMRSAAATEEERLRMLREGQAMARITHPNVITVYEVGVEGAHVFLAQELLDAGTLGEWLEEAPRSQAEILDKFIAAGHGLAAAHAAGLVHRDFKPHNVLLGTDGRVRVADFGLARALGPEGDEAMLATRPNGPRLSEATSPMSPLTRTGRVMGTPMFMAPEQHEGRPADARSDQFAFSVALYHALYGDYPFPGETSVALADAVLAGRMKKPPRGHRVPARLRQILLRGLSTKRERRYPSMNAMLAELAAQPRRPFRKVAVVIAAGTLVAGAVAGGYVLRTRDERQVQRPRRAVTVEPSTLNSERDVQWLSTAIERGQLDDAAEKYELAAALAKSSGTPAQASIAHSAHALVLALRGKLADARKQLADAEATKGSDPSTAAYLDMATAAVSFAAGSLDEAMARSTRCAKAFATISPELAATCHEINGNAVAETGNLDAARDAYNDALAIDKVSAARSISIRIARAALDLDAQKYEEVAAAATVLQGEASARDAVGPEAQAWTLLARAHLAQAATQKALEDLEHVKPEKIEPFQLAIQQRIAHGEVLALLDQRDDGLKEVEDARVDAEKHGFPGLVLAARLARLEVLTATEAPEAAAEQTQLAHDARARGYNRIAGLAETVGQR
jgi:predicted negative regulator of RcsB-dependent stress response